MSEVEGRRITIMRGSRAAGTLTRTPRGCLFQYHPEAEFADGPPGIAYSMPKREEPYVVEGVNLHPFFANLLPEGLHIQALAGHLGASLDDLFTLFESMGPDCIGDVWPDTEGAPVEAAGRTFREILQNERDLSTAARVPGVQPKLSDSRATLLTRQKNVIVKLESPAFPNLAANELATLAMAREAGLDVVDAEIIQDDEGWPALQVRRFDRVMRRGKLVSRVHVEDGCQLCDRYAADKYNLSLREVLKAVLRAATSGPREALSVLRLYTLSYLIGNADLHAKNVSIWRNPKTGVIELTPAYDLVCTLIYRGQETRMAMKMDAKDDRFRRADFVAFGDRFGLPERAISNMLNKLLEATQGWPERLANFAPSEKDAERAAGVLRERRDWLASG